MNQLGQLDIVHIQDLNVKEVSQNLEYINDVKRCEETLRRVGYLKDMCHEYGLDLQQPIDFNHFKQITQQMSQDEYISQGQLFDKIEKKVIEYEKFVKQQLVRYNNFITEFKLDLEQTELLEYAQKSFSLDSHLKSYEEQKKDFESHDQIVEPLLGNDESHSLLQDQNALSQRGVSLEIMGGIIQKSEQERLKKMIFRAFRGKCLIFDEDLVLDRRDTLKTDVEPENNRKVVYIIMFESGEFLKRKANILLHSFNGQVFDIKQDKVHE
jgi:hypothetical protein